VVQQANRSAATTGAFLKVARALFASHGYAEVTIDQIAHEAGYAKGAFYHHFSSKQVLFEQVLDSIQAELALLVVSRMQRGRAVSLPRALAKSILDYLEGAVQPSIRRILLIDGPMVLGWKRWREIDDKHFADIVRAGVVSLMAQQAGSAGIASATRLVLGAITEAALSSGTAENPVKLARLHGTSFELLLSGLQGARRSTRRGT
jgi:AcrR family transcriptional regulator